MIALGLQHVREIELKRGLISSHDEEVRKALGVNAKQRANTVGIFVFQIDDIFSPTIWL